MSLLEIPCHPNGQPFRLGMLYDSRNNCVVPGIHLSGETREELVNVSCSRVNTDVKKEARHIHFDVNASVTFRALFFSKTYSAKYLYDKTSSVDTVQAALEYKKFSLERHFSPSGKYTDEIQKQTIESGIATHLVTSIKYGCKVSLTFEKEVKNGQSQSDVKGPMAKYLKTVADGIKGGVSAEAGEGGDMLGNCNVFIDGDLKFSNESKKPKTLDEVIQYWHGVPKLVEGKYFPQAVSLLPLSSFTFVDTKISKLTIGISSVVEEEVKRVFLDLTNIASQAQKLSIDRICVRFQGIYQQVMKFKKIVSDFCSSFQQAISKAENECIDLETTKEKVLHSIYQKYATFTSHLRKWLIHEEKEIDALGKCLQFLEHKNVCKALKTGEIETLVHSFEYNIVISFEFTLIGKSNSEFFLALENYLDDDPSIVSAPIALPSLPRKWYLQPAMKMKMSQFMHFVKTSSVAKHKICFAVTCRTDEKYLDDVGSGVVILKYTNAIPVMYEVPSCPGKPEKLKASLTSISIVWDAPSKCSEIEQYKIYYHPADAKAIKSKFVKTVGTETTVTIHNLKANTGYIFKVCGICMPGITAESKPSSVIFTKGSLLAKSLLSNSSTLPCNDGQCVINACTSKPVFNNDFQIAECEIGMPQQSPGVRSHEKCVLLVGKSISLISKATDLIFNSMMNVSYKEKVRFNLACPHAKVTSDESESEWTTIYKIHQQDSFPSLLTVIQFPINTGIIQEASYAQLEACFMQFGISQLDCIILIPEESCSSPITLSQKFSLCSILSMFSSNLKNSIVALVPCLNRHKASDVAKQAKHLAQVGFPSTNVFQFYPLAHVNKSETDDESSLQIWNANEMTMKELLLFITKATSISTNETVQVLQAERKLCEAMFKLFFEKEQLNSSIKQNIFDAINFLTKNSLKVNPVYDVDILNQLGGLVGSHGYLLLKKEQARIVQDISSAN